MAPGSCTASTRKAKATCSSKRRGARLRRSRSARTGTIYAACVGDKSHNPLPPLPVQGTASITITVVQPESLQAANASTSVPEGTEIYALTEGQAPRELWSSKDDIVYALALEPDGLLALSGNRGHIFRIQDDGSYRRRRPFAGATGPQPGCQPRAPRDYIIGTGNTGKVFLTGRVGNARIRQRCSRCRSVCPLWPRGD